MKGKEGKEVNFSDSGSGVQSSIRGQTVALLDTKLCESTKAVEAQSHLGDIKCGH